MKKINKGLAVAVFAIMLTFGFSSLTVANAATTPSLGSAAVYGVLSSTYTNTSAGTTINGSIGFTTPPAVVPAGTHSSYGLSAPYATAGINQGTALTALNAEVCTFTFAPGAIDLSTDITHGPVGVYTPGVYCSTGAMDISGALNLNGVGTYIFRPSGALTSTAGSAITLSGALACDIFWTPTSATTLAANTTFVGTVISAAGITIGANTTWSGRALAFGGTVTTDTDTITVPSCANDPATFNVIKSIVNGGNATPSSFNIYVKNAGVNVLGSPVGGVSAPGTTYILSAGNYSVSEDNNAEYTQSFSGDCDSSGNIVLASGDTKTCIITNTYVPPAAVIIVNSGNNYVAPVMVSPVIVPVQPVVAVVNNIPVIIPSLPNTGFAPKGNNNSLIIISSILGLTSIALIIGLKKRNT